MEVVLEAIFKDSATAAQAKKGQNLFCLDRLIANL